MNLVQVPVEDLSALWPVAAEHLKAVLELEAREYDLVWIRAGIEQGVFALWIAYGPGGMEMVTVVENVQAGESRVLCVRWLAGNSMATWIHHMDTLVEWAKRHDYDVLEVWGRKGWVRTLRPYGFEEKYRILQKALKE